MSLYSKLRSLARGTMKRNLIYFLIPLLAFLLVKHTTSTLLPPPANLSTIPHTLHLTTQIVDTTSSDTTNRVLGGESLVLHRGLVVTGTLDGYLVGLDPDSLHVQWRVECPGQQHKCRVLGLRSDGVSLYGVDVGNGRVFRYSEGMFEWLVDRDTPGMKNITPGFMNDLVLYRDVIFITDSYKLLEDGRTMLQRFYSQKAEGMVLKYNVTTGIVSVLKDNVVLPNGIELHRSNKSLLVAEGSVFRIIEIDINTGKTLRVFSQSGTLGAVDNIRASKSGYWIGVSTGRSNTRHFSDAFSWSPTLRSILTSHPITAPILASLTRTLAEEPRVYHVTQHGDIDHVVFGGEVCSVPVLSEVLEVGEWVFVGSPFGRGVVRFRSELMYSVP